MNPVPDIAAALKYAETIISRRCGNNSYRDRAHDMTTDAILAAARNFDPAAGTWPQLYGWAVNRAVSRAIQREADQQRRRRTTPLNESDAAKPRPHLPDDLPDDLLERLPKALRRVALLHFKYGFTLVETGLLCGGKSRQAVHQSLRRIAVLMGDDLAA